MLPSKQAPADPAGADESPARRRFVEFPWRRPRAFAQGDTLAMVARLWPLAAACLILLFFVSMLALWVERQLPPQPVRSLDIFLLLTHWSLWAIVTPLVVAFLHHDSLVRWPWLQGLTAQLVVGSALALGEMVVFLAGVKAAGGLADMTFAYASWRFIIVGYPPALLIFFVIAVAAHAVLESHMVKQRELETEQLHSQITEAQLDALRMQLQPHFLCNTLNTAAVFLRDGRSEQAGDIITGLGELLHTALATMGTQEIPLREELAFVLQYLDIERTRFSDRMEVRVKIDEDLLDGLVPCMILQPVVENAIRHGIAQDPSAGRISIAAGREGSELTLTVDDDGPGLTGPRSPDPGHGVGLRNARQRLERLYGDAGHIRLRTPSDGGFGVDIYLPFHTRAVTDSHTHSDI